VNQERFIRAREEDWQKMAHLLDAPKKASGEERHDADFPRLFRAISHDLALARSRMYSQQLIERLNQLVTRAHQRLYRTGNTPLQNIGHYVTGGFARNVRAQWRYVLASAAIFYLPMITMMVLVIYQPNSVYTILDGETVRQVESMYDPGDPDSVGRGMDRKSDTDLMMLGFYIKNNTGIGFRTFAGGLLAGIGTLFFLLFNGFYLGAVAGHLTQIGYIETFWGFVAGHSALELNAIVLSGACGLMLGHAIIAPGRRSRRRALMEEAGKAMGLIYGTAGMFLLAAMVEAFWSPSAVMPPESKYVVGILLWCLLLVYFLMAGRTRAA